jgi:hypothetical protein
MEKKALEQLLIARFLEVIQARDLGHMSAHENPDFLLQSDSGMLGIEITRLYRKAAPGESPLKEQEVLREGVMKRAKAIYEGRALPPIHVSVHFNQAFRLRKQAVEQTAAVVAALGERLIPDTENGSTSEEYEWTNRAYFPDTIDHVMVYRMKGATHSSWSAPSVGFLPELSPAEVAQRISEKELRLSDYMKACSRVWLVLVSRGDMLSSVVDLTEAAKQATYSSGFERIFWFAWPNSAHELKVTAGPRDR